MLLCNISIQKHQRKIIGLSYEIKDTLVSMNVYLIYKSDIIQQTVHSRK